MNRRYFCCDERRRGIIDGRTDLNGIDFIEVLDDEGTLPENRQRTLFLHFINDPVSLNLTGKNVSIEGGERQTYLNPRVLSATIKIDARCGTETPVLVVEVNQPGDFSIYTLRLINDNNTENDALSGMDPMLRSIDFSFKVNCASDFDCGETLQCADRNYHEPVINYLAKDYNSFRQLMLDRLAVLMPDWRERNPADMGIALVELLAYVGDYLSYRQDAVATEAYLETARSRISVRRHARLVDYFMHDGGNARAWIHVNVDAAVTLDRETQFLTAAPDTPARLTPNTSEYRKVLGIGAEVFESLHSARLFPSLNQLQFYTWGARECCLPKGATRAVLFGRQDDLQEGMVLLFKEVLNPNTGDVDDADPSHRHAVRLIDVTTGESDPIGGQFMQPPSDDPVEITRISWSDDDALPFPLCISAQSDDDIYVDSVTIALGNIVLADHGRSIENEILGEAPEPHLLQRRHAESKSHPSQTENAHCGKESSQCGQQAQNFSPIPARFRPGLKEKHLTQAAPFDISEPAYAAMHWDASTTIAEIRLQSQSPERIPHSWDPQKDLLNSGARREFVVEVENDGSAVLRFGDGRYGRRPQAGESFTASYRIGNGVQGNIGAESLFHVVTHDSAITAITNPMPATGGVDMESIDHVLHNAPYAFRTQQRAVTPADYAHMAERLHAVQKATSRMLWTGSWHTVFLTADRIGGARLDADFEQQLRRHLEPFRLTGHDLEIDRARRIALKIIMQIDVSPDFERSNVRAELLKIFSNRELPNGRRGVFHPDNFTFGQTLFLSPLYAAAQGVAGVEAAEITVFERQESPGAEGLENGKLPMGRFEIAQLENNPNFPSRGVFGVALRGGR
jgi:uncharacterized protein YcbK (DUF882 family)